jgi:hypothetical protein
MERKDPIISLIELNTQIIKLDRVQAWIDHAREVASGNQIVQLELDRHQSDINSKRELIALTMLDIRSRN